MQKQIKNKNAKKFQLEIAGIFDMKGEKINMKKILVATNNLGKLEEIRKIVKNVELISLKDIDCNINVEEDQETFEGNSKKKAEEAAKITKMPTIADDSGLCIEAFDGWPGVHTARFLGENATQEEKNNAILEKMKDLKRRTKKCKICMCYDIL